MVSFLYAASVYFKSFVVFKSEYDGYDNDDGDDDDDDDDGDDDDGEDHDHDRFLKIQFPFFEALK